MHCFTDLSFSVEDRVIDDTVSGATHVSEYPYIFNTYPLGKFDIAEHEEDATMAQFFQESWANFVKSGCVYKHDNVIG